MEASGAFYRAVLTPLGYEADETEEGLRFSLADALDKDNGPGTIYVQPPFDGGPARPANGVMPGFRAGSRDMVDHIHQAGLDAGGVDEGAPGTRPYYTERFYVAYLRDPVGNKLAIFTVDA
jgi:hypothetical protein